MGKCTNERAWRESMAWEKPESKEPVTEDEFEEGYSDFYWDRLDREVRFFGGGK